MPFISNTDKQRKAMLKAIGFESFEELIADIPPKFLNEQFNLEKPYSEYEIRKRINDIASQNVSCMEVSSFLGGGIYDHFVPAIVDYIISRPEFHSAYTPYQAEVSQGTLQAIYEFQTMICELTGMEIANAGMYDGASAAGEAILMAARATRKSKAIIAGTLNPRYKEVIKAYTEGVGIDLVFISNQKGQINMDKLRNELDNDIAAVLIQTPNYFGILENMFEIEKLVHAQKKAKLIAAVDPISLAILNAPSQYNADIVIGEGQALGNKQNYGGPLFGFMATNKRLARKLPGRIVGATIDADGEKCYSLTLQTREQHIRRDKATSNICSNQALCSLAATVYMAIMGKKGLKEVAIQSTKKAHYLAKQIKQLNGYEIMFSGAFFKEFVIKTPIKASIIISKLKNKHIFAGIDMKELGYEKGLLIAVTEKKTKQELDNFVNALKEV